MDNRLGSSSMFFPDEKKFDIHKIEKKVFDKFKVTRSLDVECDTISNLLNDLNIENLDFLNENNINFKYLYRNFDQMTNQYCNKGFFNFKKFIPKILSKLDVL